MFICTHCKSERKSKNSLLAHEVTCSSNPSRTYKNGMLGKRAWNKGLNISDPRVAQYTINSAAARKGKLGKPHTNETKDKLSKHRIKRLDHDPFYSKRSTYNGVTLDSSYELIVAKSLDENNVKWIRPTSLIWNDNGQIRRYLPDFYLPEYSVYLDPKNDYLINKDKRKIHLTEKHNNVRIIILNKSELTWDKIINIIMGVHQVMPRVL